MRSPGHVVASIEMSGSATGNTTCPLLLVPGVNDMVRWAGPGLSI